MYIKVGTTVYTQIRNLRFAPETDVLNSEIAINQFSAEIKTQTGITPGLQADLCDSTGRLWARYWVTKAEQVDKDYLLVEAKSILLLLDRVNMSPTMYDMGQSAAEVIQECFNDLENIYGNQMYELDPTLDLINYTISGFCPAQTARERLQWVCFVTGAYVQTFFHAKIRITKIPAYADSRAVALKQTYWAPKISLKDRVSALVIKAYSYVDGEPSTTDEWVEDGHVVYIQSDQTFRLDSSDDPPAGVEDTPNEISFEKITIVNSGNATAILTRLSAFYFKQYECEAEIVDAGDIKPGDRVFIPTNLMDHTDPANPKPIVVNGIIQSADFTFGRLAKARVRLSDVGQEIAVNVVINLMYYGDVQQGELIETMKYMWPAGASYSIELPYVDKTYSDRRRIYISQNEAATGTTGSVDIELDEECDIALERIQKNLFMNSVDSIEEDNGILEIA